MTPERTLTAMALELPPPPKPGGIYKPVLAHGGLVYVSGHAPCCSDGSFIRGVVGADLSLEEGKKAARQVGLSILSSVRAALGSLDRISGVIKVLGMVNAAPDFEEHPQVINGCSQLFADLFGEEKGIGVRSAVGMGSLPGNIAVEIEAIFELAE